MANLYTAAESNRSDYLKLKVSYTFNGNYRDTIARLSITYTITKSTSTGYSSPPTRYGILTSGTVVNSSGQITTSGSLLQAVQLDSITDISTSGGTITKTINFDFVKGTSATTYSGVTFLINNNNTSTTQTANTDTSTLGSYLWTGQQGSSVSAKPIGFAIMSLTIPKLSGVARVNVNGTWKTGTVYVNVNGTWKQGIPYINVNGTWKQGI